MSETAAEPLEGRLHLAHVESEVDGELLVRLHDGTDVWVPAAERGGAAKDGAPHWVFVDHWSDKRGAFIGSVEMADRLRLLDRAERAHKDRETVEGEIVSHVEGGYAVDVDGLRAFLPSSQVGLRPVSDPEALIGQRFSFRVIRFHRGRVNVVLSRRPILEAERTELLGQIRTGAVVEGLVRGHTDNGVLFDVSGTDGFMHISDATWARESDPKKVAEVGQKFRLKVLGVDKKRSRLKLGLRQIEDDPWAKADEKYPPGTEVSGIVVSKTDYGCFVEFEPGLEGFIFASGELTTDEARTRLRKTDVGDELQATVVEVNLVARRITLRLL